MANIKIPEYGQHMIFLGMTGCGKSLLAQEIINKYKRFFLFDTQDSLDLKGKRVIKPTEALEQIKLNTDRICYCPEMKFHTRDINNLLIGALLDSSRKRKKHPRVVYIDEIFQLGYMQSFPENLPKAFALGRQRGISMAVSTQRPKLIPTNLISEASHMFIFKLKKPDDIDYIGKMITERQEEFYSTLKAMDIDEHKFIYVNMRSGYWELCNPVNLTIKGKGASRWMPWK